MEQRDYMLREIEKIGAMILAMIGKLKGASGSTEFEAAVEMIDADIEEITGIPAGEIIMMPPGDFIQRLSNNTGFNEANMENMADLLTEMAMGMSKDESASARRKAIILLEWIDEHGRTYSFDRQSKLAELRGLV